MIVALKQVGRLADGNLLNLGFPLAVLLIFTPFFPGLAAQYGVAHPAQAIAVYMTVMAMLIAFRVGLGIKPHLLDIFFVGFVVFIVGSLIIEGARDRRQGLVYVISAMLVPYVFARLMTQSDIKVFVRATVSLALILIPICIYGISKLGYYDASIERLVLFGWLFGPGTFGLAIGILIPLSVVFILSEAAQQKKLLAWLIIPITMWTVVTLGARSIFVSGLSTSFLILMFARVVGLRRRLALGGFLILCAIISLNYLHVSRANFYGQLVTSTAPTTTPAPASAPAPAASTTADCKIQGNSIAIRYILYREAIDLLVANPISGVGAGNFGFYSCFTNEHQPFASPHSTVLHVLSELGLMGGLLFFGIVLIVSIGLIKQIWRDGFEGENLTAWMLTALWIYYFIVDQFSHSYFTVVHFFLLAGVIASLLANGRFRSVVESNKGRR